MMPFPSQTVEKSKTRPLKPHLGKPTNVAKVVAIHSVVLVEQSAPMMLIEALSRDHRNLLQLRTLFGGRSRVSRPAIGAVTQTRSA
jgi:hypothetical protein